jgi:hypothetical protein
MVTTIYWLREALACVGMSLLKMKRWKVGSKSIGSIPGNNEYFQHTFEKHGYNILILFAGTLHDSHPNNALNDSPCHASLDVV